MRISSTNYNSRPTSQQGHARVVFLMLVAFALGLVASALWFSHKGDSNSPMKVGEESIGQLSESTRAVLQGLEAPVELRFYALLGSESVPASFSEFSGRVKKLLLQYQGESKGLIKLTCLESNLPSIAKAASADGITPLNAEKGNPSYLGLTVAQADQKEILAQLSPEWEQALESDITRAILRVSAARALAKTSGASTPPDSTAIAEVKRFIPDPAATTFEEGTRILREETLKEFKLTNQELETQVKDLQKRISEAPASDRETAMQQLRQLQAAQFAKLKQIAGRADLRIAAWEAIKRAFPSKATQ